MEEEHGHTTTVVTPDPEDSDHVMLVRPRKSRIYYLRRFFDYPIKLSGNTIKNLGPVRMVRIGISYVAARVQARSRKRRVSRTSSSTASGASSTSRSSRATPKRSGERLAIRSRPSGERSASRASV